MSIKPLKAGKTRGEKSLEKNADLRNKSAIWIKMFML
jgi:hypothetical protein